MKSERIDMTGDTFGLLKVVRFAGTDSRGRAKWLCRCRCQNWRVCMGGELRADRTKACRKCSRAEMAERMREVHRRKVAKTPAVALSNPAEIVPLLTPEQKARYDRWDGACKRFAVPVTASERMQVLKEILA